MNDKLIEDLFYKFCTSCILSELDGVAWVVTKENFFIALKEYDEKKI